MAIAFDALGAGAYSTSGTISWSHTLSASATDIVVVIGEGNSGDNPTCKVGTTSMTSLGKVNADNATSGFVQVFILSSPPTGVQTIATTGGGTVGNSMSFTGSNGHGTVFTAFGSGTAQSVAITSTTSGNLCVAGFASGTSGTVTVGGTGTLRFHKDGDNASAANNCSGITAPSTGSSVTISDTAPNDFWGAVGFELVAAGGGGSTGIPDLIMAPMGG